MKSTAGLPPAAANVEEIEDPVLPTTRVLSALLALILLAGGVFFFLNAANAFIAPLTGQVLSAGLLAAAYFFIRAAVARRWHRISGGYMPYVVFGAFLALTTLLNRADLPTAGLPYYLWLALAIASPLLALGAWLANRPAVRGARIPGDLSIPLAARRIKAALGLALLLAGLAFFFAPGLMASFWPWPVDAISARVLAAVLILSAMVDFVIGLNRKWALLRILFESQIIGLALALVAAGLSWGSLNPGAATYVLLGLAALVLVWMLVTYLSIRPPRKVSFR